MPKGTSRWLLIAETAQIAFPHRGEIYLVSFDPTVGHEIQKTRPAVIVQNDSSNQYSPITIVAAISTQFADPSIDEALHISLGLGNL